MSKKAFKLSGPKQQQAKKRAEEIKEMIKKKRLEKKTTESTDQSRSIFENLIDQGDKPAILETMANTPPPDLLKMTLTENHMGQPLIAIAAQKQLDYFFKALSELMLPHEHLVKDFLASELDVCKKDYLRLLRIIIDKASSANKTSNHFARVLATELIPMKGNPIRQIFKEHLGFEQIKELLTDNKSEVQLIHLMMLHSEALELPKLAATLKEYEQYCKCQISWTKVEAQGDLTIFLFPELSYNIIHFYANSMACDRFFKAAEFEPNLKLFNAFNGDDETPIDIALRKFDLEGVENVLELVKNNFQLHLSTNALNKLLDNRAVYQNQKALLEFILAIKSEDIMLQGYVERIKISHGDYDISEFSDLDYVLPKLDCRREYPLIKYIQHSNNPDTKILQELFFKELTREYNQVTYYNFLKINQVMQRVNLKSNRTFKNVNEGIIQKKILMFDSSVRKLFEVALAKGNDKVIKFAVENAFSNIFMIHLTEGADYYPHLLRCLLEHNQLAAAEVIMKTPEKLIEFNPTLIEEDFEQVYKVSKFDKKKSYLRNVTFNLLNEILLNFSSLPIINPITQQIKDFLKAQYTKNPKLIFSSFLYQNRVVFVINRISYFMTPEQALPYYREFVQRFNPGEKQLLPEKQGEEVSDDSNFLLNQFKMFRLDYFSNNQNYLNLVTEFKVEPAKRFIQNFLDSIQSTDFQSMIKNVRPQLKQNNQVVLLQLVPVQKLISEFEKAINKGNAIELLWTLENILYSKQKQGPYPSKSVIQLIDYVGSILNKDNIDKCSSLIKSIYSHREGSEPIELKQQQVLLEGEFIDRVKLLAGLGLDSYIKATEETGYKFLKGFKPSDYYSKIVYRMIKENSPFSKIVFESSKGTLQQFKQFLKNQQFLMKFSKYFGSTHNYKNRSVVFSHGQYNWQLVQQTFKALKSQNPEKSSQYEENYKFLQMQQIKNISRFAEVTNIYEYLQEFLTSSPGLQKIYLKNPMVDHIVQQLGDRQRKIKEREQAQERTEQQLPEVPPLLTEDSQQLYKDIIHLIQKYPKSITKEILKLFNTDFYQYMNLLMPTELYKVLSLLVPKLGQKDTMTIFMRVFKGHYQRFDNDSSEVAKLEQFLLTVAENQPNIYLDMIQFIWKNGGKQKTTERSLLQNSLIKVYFKNQDIAYKQLLWCIQNNVLNTSSLKETKQQQKLQKPKQQKQHSAKQIHPQEQQSEPVYVVKQKYERQQQIKDKTQELFPRYNNILKFVGFKGHSPTILTVLFLSNKLPSVFRLYDKKQLITYNASSAQTTFIFEHFKEYVEIAIKLIKKLPQLQSRLEECALRLIKARIWDRVLYLITRMAAEGWNLTSLAWRAFQAIKVKGVNEDYYKCLDLLYKQLLKLTPRPDYLKKIPVENYKRIILLKPDALADLEVEDLDLLKFFSLLSVSMKQKNSVKLQERFVIKTLSPEDKKMEVPAIRWFFQKVRPELKSQKIEIDKTDCYKTILNHVRFLRNYFGYEFTWEKFPQQLIQLQRRFLIRLQNDLEGKCVYEKTNLQANMISSKLLTSKQVADYKNLLQICPNLLNDTQPAGSLTTVSQTRNARFVTTHPKQFILKYANPQLIRTLVKNKFFNWLHFPYVIMSGDLEATKQYFSQLGKQVVMQQFEDKKNIMTLLSHGNQQYSVDLIKELGLHQKLWNLQVSDFGNRKDNILGIICEKKLTKLLNQLYLYLKNHDRLGEVTKKLRFEGRKDHIRRKKKYESIDEKKADDIHRKRRPLLRARKLNFYEYIFLNRPGPILTHPNHGFKCSSRYLNPDEIKRARADLPDLPGYVATLSMFEELRALITGGFTQAQQKQTGIKLQNTFEQFLYSIKLHQTLQKIVFKMMPGPTIQQIKALQLDPLRYDIMVSLKYLAYGLKGQDYKTVLTLLLAIIILYNPENKVLTDDLHNNLRNEAAIAKYLRGLIPPTKPIKAQSKFFDVALNKQLGSKLSDVIFRNFQQQIVKLGKVDHLIANLPSSYVLLPEIIKQEKFDLLKLLIEQLNIQSNTSALFTMVLFIVSNYPDAKQFILAGLNKDPSTSAIQLLLDLANDSEAYFFSTTLKKVQEYSQIPNYFTNYQDDKTKQKDITECLNRLNSLNQKQTKKIDFTLFAGSVKKQFMKWSKMKAIHTQLGLVMVYAHLSRLMKRLDEIKEHQLTINVQLMDYEGYSKDWVRMYRIAEDKWKIQLRCLVCVSNSQTVYEKINIDEYFEKILLDIDNRLYLSEHKTTIAEKINAIANSRRALYLNELISCQNITVDLDSFEKLVDYSTKQRLFPIIEDNKNILFLQDFFDTIDNTVSGPSIAKPNNYEINDVSAPHTAGTIEVPVTRIFPEFYNLIRIPGGQSLRIVYKTKEQYEHLQKSSKEKILSDLKAYIKYFSHVLKTPEAPVPTDIRFTCELYYYVDEAEFSGRVHVLPAYYSAWNIYSFSVALESVYATFLKELANGFNLIISAESFIHVFEPIILNHKANFFMSLKRLLQLQNMSVLVAELIKMVTSNGSNIMSVVKGICIEFVEVKEGPTPFVLFDKPRCTASEVKYSNVSNVMVVSIGVTKKLTNQIPEIEQYKGTENLELLINQKDFLDCMFSTPQQLTNYFLDRRSLDNQVHTIANKLTTSKDKMIHLSIDYESLYKIVKKLEKSRNLEDLKTLLGGVAKFIEKDLSDKLNQEYESLGMSNLYLLYLQFLSETSQSGADILKTPELFNEQVLKYKMSAEQQPLSYVLSSHSYFSCGSEEKEVMTNTFVIQIYRNYFASSFVVGNVYILGMKDGSNSLLRIKNKNTLDDIKVENIRWVLWVTRKIPEETFLDIKKVIRVYISDLSGNLYLLNEHLKTILMRSGQEEDKQQADINNVIPVLPNNITVKFTDSEHDLDVSLPSIMRSQSANNPQDLYSHQTVVLRMDPNSGSIKYCNFTYPTVNFSQQVRLSGKVQQRIQSFIKSMSNLYNRPLKQTLSISFDDGLSALPEITDFEKLLSCVCYELEKSFEEFAKIESRDRVVEENVSLLFEKVSLNKNYLGTLRLNRFEEEFKELRLEFNSGKGNSYQFTKDSMLIKIDVKFNTDQTSINFMTILEALVDEIFSRIKPNAIKGLQFSLKNTVDIKMLKLNQKIRLLDLLLLVDIQVQNCDIARRTLVALGKEVTPYLMTISSSGESSVQAGKLNTLITLNFKQQTRLFTFCNILEQVHLLKQDPLVDGSVHTFTEYCLEDKQIHIYNSKSKVQTLIAINKPDRGIKIDKLPSVKQVSDKNWTIDYERSGISGCDNCIYLVLTGKTILFNVVNTRLRLNQHEKTVCNIERPSSVTFNILNTEYSVVSLDKLELYYRLKGQSYDLLRKVSNVNFTINLSTRNLFTITVNSRVTMVVGLIHPALEFPFQLLSKGRNECLVEIKSENLICIEKTEFLGVKKREALVAPRVKSDTDSKEERFKEPPEKVQAFRAPKEVEATVDIAEILDTQKPLSVVKDQFKYITKAGYQRTDVIRFCDENGNALDVSLEEVSVMFEYCENNMLKDFPQKVKKENYEVHLIWEPFIRGRYRMFINEAIVDPGYEIIVSSEDIDRAKTKVFLPTITHLSYCEMSTLSVSYKDRFGNIFGDLEYDINREDVLLEMVAFEGGNNIADTVKFKIRDVDKFGVQTCEFFFMLPPAASELEEKTIDVRVLFMREPLQSFKVTVKGLSIEKRKQFFTEALNKLPQSPGMEITVNRFKFMEGLTNFEKTDLKRHISVKFEGEPGIDAGGVKREFFDLIGAQLKNERHPFFKPIMSNNRLQYMLNPELLKNKKQNVYMKVFGKFLANSILSMPNSYLIGVDFADAFIKTLYGYKIEFADLKEIIEPAEFNRYETMKKFKPSEFEDLMLDFTLHQDGKSVELCEDGAHLAVTAENVEKYLNSIADYKIRNRFEEPIKNFLEGFNSVLPFDLVRTWFRPHELSILTCGIKELKAESIIEVLIIEGGGRVIQDWFKRYIRECTPEMLKKFLKFTTGSSSIPFDTSSYKIQIQFHSSANTKKLPISHTCWKSIEIPVYKTYEIMEKKLTAAFTLGAEGFGFG